MDIATANAAATELDAEGIIRYACEYGPAPALVSTNFRPGEAVILHLLTRVQPDIPVLWVDHGYNTSETYRCAEQLIERLQLNVQLFTPRRTRAHREALQPELPEPDTPAHDALTEELKLEPFRRGLRSLRPGTWFTALRREQTAFRAALQAFATDATGLVDYPLVKVCPLLDWDEARMQAYLREHDLPDETIYFDPTKVHGSRECGLHPGKG